MDRHIKYNLLSPVLEMESKIRKHMEMGLLPACCNLVCVMCINSYRLINNCLDIFYSDVIDGYDSWGVVQTSLIDQSIRHAQTHTIVTHDV